MASDLRTWENLPDRLARRLSFLDHEIEEGVAAVPCRLPGCGSSVKRDVTRGRTAWFHKRACYDEFRRRRRALDTAISESAARYLAEDTPWTTRLALASDIKWLAGVRESYVTDKEWTIRIALEAEGSSKEVSVQTLLRMVQAGRHSAEERECPVCQGVGELAALPEPRLLSWTERRRAGHELLLHIGALLHRLQVLLPGVATASWAIEIQDVIDDQRGRSRS